MPPIKTHDLGVIGAGHSGMAMAVMAARQGLKVALYAHPDHRTSNFDPLFKTAGVAAQIHYSGTIQGTAAVTLIGELQALVSCCREVSNNLPEYAHEQLIDDLAACHYLGSVYVSTPTANGFSLKARNRIQPRGFIDCVVASAASRAGGGKVHIAGIKSGMYVALFPSDLPDSALDIYRKIYPHQEIRRLQNPLGSLLANANLWIHTMPLLFASVALEMGVPGLYFYPNCVGATLSSLHCANLAQHICGVAKAYGIDIPLGVDILAFEYGFEAEGANPNQRLRHLVKSLPTYSAHPFLPDASKVANSRMLAEDPSLLNILATLARIAGLDESVLLSVVHTAGMATKEAYQPQAEDLSRLDMKGLTTDQIVHEINLTSREWRARWAAVRASGQLSTGSDLVPISLSLVESVAESIVGPSRTLI